MKKNRKKGAELSPLTMVVLVVTALSLGATGVAHTVLKNRQLELVREIEQVELKVKDCERDLTNLEIRYNGLSNRYDLRDRLNERGTELRGIPIEAIEDIRPILAELASN